MLGRYSDLFITLPERLWENQLALHFEFYKFKLSKTFCGKNHLLVSTNYMLRGLFKLPSKNLSLKKIDGSTNRKKVGFPLAYA